MDSIRISWTIPNLSLTRVRDIFLGRNGQTSFNSFLQ